MRARPRPHKTIGESTGGLGVTGYRPKESRVIPVCACGCGCENQTGLVVCPGCTEGRHEAPLGTKAADRDWAEGRGLV